MYCKQCGNHNEDGMEKCTTCGAPLTSSLDIPSSSLDAQQVDKHKTLVFNVIYACLTMAGAAPNIPGVVEGLFSVSSITELLGILLGCAISAYGLATGILLLQKKKLGRVFAMINSVLGSIGGLLMTIGGGILTFGSASFLSGVDIEQVFGIFGAIIGVGLLIAGVFALAYNIFSTVYYVKKKEHFE